MTQISQRRRTSLIHLVKFGTHEVEYAIVKLFSSFSDATLGDVYFIFLLFIFPICGRNSLKYNTSFKLIVYLGLLAS